MKTLAVKIPEKLDLQLQSLSKQRKVSKSKIVRDAIRECLERQKDHQELSAFDLMKDGLGILRSDCDDLASNSEHMNGFGR